VKLPQKRTFEFYAEDDTQVWLVQAWWRRWLDPAYSSMRFLLWGVTRDWLNELVHGTPGARRLKLVVSTRPMLNSIQLKRTTLHNQATDLNLEYRSHTYNWESIAGPLRLCDDSLKEIFGFSPTYLWVQVIPKP
jgi:hypothetical protein